MASKKVVTDVFLAAFKALSSSEQRAILGRVLKMRKWRKDLVDIAIAEKRAKEKSRPFRTFLAEN